MTKRTRAAVAAGEAADDDGPSGDSTRKAPKSAVKKAAGDKAGSRSSKKAPKNAKKARADHTKLVDKFIVKLATRLAVESDGATQDVPEHTLRTSLAALPDGIFKQAIEADFQAALSKFEAALAAAAPPHKDLNADKPHHGVATKSSGSKRRRTAADNAVGEATSLRAFTGEAFEAARARALEGDDAVLRALFLDPCAPADITIAHVHRDIDSTPADMAAITAGLRAVATGLSAQFTAFSSEGALAPHFEKALDYSTTLTVAAAAACKHTSKCAKQDLEALPHALAALRGVLGILRLKFANVTSQQQPLRVSALHAPPAPRPNPPLQQVAARVLAQYAIALAAIADTPALVSAVTSSSGAEADSGSDSDEPAAAGGGAAAALLLRRLLSVCAAQLDAPLAALHFLLAACAAAESARDALPNAGALLLCEACSAVHRTHFASVPMPAAAAAGDAAAAALAYLAPTLAARAVAALLQRHAALDAALPLRARRVLGAAARAPAPAALLSALQTADALAVPAPARAMWQTLSAAAAAAVGGGGAAAAAARGGAAVTQVLLANSGAGAAELLALLSAVAAITHDGGGGSAEEDGGAAAEVAHFYEDRGAGALQSLRGRRKRERVALEDDDEVAGVEGDDARSAGDPQEEGGSDGAGDSDTETE
ncbi:hypothetical protein JKP88DRAFT_248875 [Tribonema minus]|uniref:Uncharacterized protein n=1 Tax=Tribonema minus TaxID=303371 RepID=A0A835YKU4_9STRA|nr:hypothetical protein JKP88DRAFT_248875 [Tribonema minus]